MGGFQGAISTKADDAVAKVGKSPSATCVVEHKEDEYGESRIHPQRSSIRDCPLNSRSRPPSMPAPKTHSFLESDQNEAINSVS